MAKIGFICLTLVLSLNIATQSRIKDGLCAHMPTNIAFPGWAFFSNKTIKAGGIFTSLVHRGAVNVFQCMVICYQNERCGAADYDCITGKCSLYGIRASVQPKLDGKTPLYKLSSKTGRTQLVLLENHISGMYDLLF